MYEDLHNKVANIVADAGDDGVELYVAEEVARTILSTIKVELQKYPYIYWSDMIKAWDDK